MYMCTCKGNNLKDKTLSKYVFLPLLIVINNSLYDNFVFSKSGDSLYQTLGIQKGAGHDEIKKAYRKVSKMYSDIDSPI